VVVLHIWALHMHGSNNPIGIDAKGPQDKIPFHPYYTAKDAFGLAAFFIVFAAVVFFAPNMFGEPDNYIPANPLVTPAHIVPEWYFLPYYAILRAIPDKLLGVLAMFGSILILFILPWLDTSRVRSGRFRPTFRIFFWLFVFDCLVLGYIGAKPPEGWYLHIGRLATAWYFAHFLVVLPLLGWFERPRPLPASISEPVLKGAKGLLAVLAVGFGVLGFSAAPVSAAESLPKQKWSFDGPFGTFDPAARQRGFQVYRDVCSACHALSLVHYRNLRDIGFSEDEVKAIAASVEVTDGPNDNGEMFQRPGRPSDRFKSPFPNEKAARAGNNGAYPVDLSLITKARVGGPDYLYALLTGYSDPPAGVKLMEGMHYNKYFHGHQIAMPPPINADQVTYADGTKATVEQLTKDVTTFLTWAAEPELEARKRLGMKVVIFLIVLTGLLFAVKRKVWKDIH
jgi:ubiquinol-cytochrome c reductase cytochrome b/c1 subunit